MVEFTSEPLELKVGDIVIESNTLEPSSPAYHEDYWVIYKVQEKIGYGNNRKGYYAFLLTDAEHTIGPVVFRNAKNIWEYKVIHYD
jgi:hypothetical protein